jgi:hypothetical protein
MQEGRVSRRARGWRGGHHAVAGTRLACCTPYRHAAASPHRPNRVPLSPQHTRAPQANRAAPAKQLLLYFEATILDQGELGKIGVGFTPRDVKLTRQPGCVRALIGLVAAVEAPAAWSRGACFSLCRGARRTCAAVGKYACAVQPTCPTASCF